MSCRNKFIDSLRVCSECNVARDQYEFSGCPLKQTEKTPTPRTPYFSIDIETTGLDPEWCQILEFGAVYEDWETPVDKLPSFHAYIVHERIVGMPYALQMHPEILKKIAERHLHLDCKFLKPVDLFDEFNVWLWDLSKTHKDAFDSRRINVAGKNFSGFDLQFLKKLPGNWDLIRHRVIDPGTLFWNPDEDKELPNTQECLTRSGAVSWVAHTAVEDARQVIELIRGAFR